MTESVEERNSAYGIHIPNSLSAECVPLDALVIVKYFDEDGDVCYAIQSTGGVHSVEALGMLDYGREQLTHNMFSHHDHGGSQA